MSVKRLVSSVASLALVFSMTPSAAFAAASGNADGESGDVSPAQIEGTAGVDYVDGEVLVAVRGGMQALQAETSTSAFEQLFGASANQAGESSFNIEETLADVSVDDIANAAEDLGTASEVDLDASSGGLSTLSLSSDDIEIIQLECEDTAQTIADLQNLDCVVAAQPSYIYSLIEDEESDEETADAVVSATQDGAASKALGDSAQTASAAGASATDAALGTDEPFFEAQWSLQNETSLKASGYSGTTSLNAEDAWAEGAGNERDGEVVVALIDSGVDYTHEDLAANMWTGGEAGWSTALGGGKYGVNVISDGQSNDPMDTINGHGTHCASVIAAAWNGTGIAGVNNKAKIMAVRAIPGATAAAVTAYNYVITAKENGVNVVAASNSWGPGSNTGSRDTLLDAIVYKAGTEGIVSVFAAGNNGFDTDLIAGQHFNNSNPYLLQVGALTSKGEAPLFSQYGKRSVDIFSPGVRVLAATSTYGEKNGRSILMDAEYLPWLKDSVSNKSEYFLDDMEDTAGPDGITYDLVALDEEFSSKHIGEVSTMNKGYDNAGVNNNKSLKVNLKDTEEAVGAGLTPAIRVTIPAETWESYKSQKRGDNLFISTLGAFSSGSGFTDPYAKIYVKTNSGWEKQLRAIEGIRDYNWYSLAVKTSLSALDSARGENGELTILLTIEGLGKTTFTDDDYFYIDNLSLGWACCSDVGTANANGAYYYDDGTSMATPNVAGVVSLLSSHAKAASSNPSGYLQSAETASDIVSFVKGGVTRLDSLSDKCSMGGAANAELSYSAFKAYESATTESARLAATANLRPVSDAITDNGDGTSTLSGSFFGSEQGSVTFKGTELNVTKWTDSAITFRSLQYSKEQLGKVEVTKANGVSGQSYLILPAGSNSVKAFASLPNPDFEIAATYSGKDNRVVTVQGNADDVTPQQMVAAEGSVYVYGQLGFRVPVLMRYDIASGTWESKNYLNEYVDTVDASNSDVVSMAAGASELYIKYQNKDAQDRLLTVDLATGTVKYDVAITASTNTLGSIGFMEDKLFLVGGKSGEPACTAIYPDTGAAYWSPSATLPIDAIGGIVTCNGAVFTITGSFNSTQKNDYGYTAGVRNEEIDVFLPNKVDTFCAVSDAVFFPQADKPSQLGLDEGQSFAGIAAAAADGAVIVTGPVRNNEADDMVDTWIYDTQMSAWSALPTRFAPTAEYALCACTYGGIYYVMATDKQKIGATLRFSSFPLDGWGLTDDSVTPTSNAQCDPGPKGAIAEQPQSATAKEGDAVTMSVAATGEVKSYQWQNSSDGANWNDLAWEGAATSKLSFKMAAALNGYKWRCVVTFADGTAIESSAATTTLQEQPKTGAITQQPSDQTLSIGELATLRIATTEGVEVSSYQWQYTKDGVKWDDLNCEGADTAALSFKMVAALDGCMWRCVVSFADGTRAVSSTATSVVKVSAPVGSITTQPKSVKAKAGAKVVLSVKATQAASYKWQYSKNGKKWSDFKLSEGKKLSFAMAKKFDNRQWRCIVTFKDGHAETSKIATTKLK